MPGKCKSSFQNVLSDNFVHLHCHQPSAIKHNNKRKKQRKEKARAENEVKESLLRLEQNRIATLVSTSTNIKKGANERISALDELQQLDIPPFKSVNWSSNHFAGHVSGVYGLAYLQI